MLSPADSRRVAAVINHPFLNKRKREFYRVVRSIDSLAEAPDWVIVLIESAEQDIQAALKGRNY